LGRTEVRLRSRFAVLSRMRSRFAVLSRMRSRCCAVADFS
jgi:hypothetical protein